MRRTTTLLLAGCLLAGTPAQLCGDCNGDDAVTILDSLVAAQVGVGLTSLGSPAFEICNVEGAPGSPGAGGTVDVLDALRLAQHAAGLVGSLACQTTISCAVTGAAQAVPVAPVLVDYAVVNELAVLVDVAVEFTTDGGLTFAPATVGAGGDPVTGLTSGPAPGVAHLYSWDSLVDGVGLGGPQTAELRLTVSAGVMAGTCLSPPVTVDNRSLPGFAITVHMSGGAPLQVHTLNLSGVVTGTAGYSLVGASRPVGGAIHPFQNLGFVIDLDQGIYAVTIDPGTGALAEVPGGLTPLGGYCRAFALAPSGNQLYAHPAFSGDLRAFDVLPGGLLVPLAIPSFPGGDLELYLGIDPTGQYLYESCRSSNDIHMYTLDASGLPAPVPGSPLANPAGGGTTPTRMAFTPGPARAYNLAVPDPGSALITGFDIDPTRALVHLPSSPTPTGGMGDYMCCGSDLEWDGQRLFATNNDGGGLSVLDCNPVTGALTPVPGSPFPTGGNLTALGLHPISGRLYGISTTSSSSLWAFDVDPGTGALSALPGSPFPIGNLARDVVLLAR